MSKKGGGGTVSVPTTAQTVTTNTAPWSGQQPYLSFGFQQAQDLYNQGGPQYFPGQTLASLAPQMTQAIAATTQRALDGSPLVTAAQNTLTGLENGQFLSAGNPYFQQMFQNVANAVTPAVTQSFEGNGRYGSGAYANALSSALAQQAGNLAYQNYSQGLNDLLQGARLAPTLANQDYVDLGQLASAGSTQQGLDQQQINAAIDRYNYNQNLPYNTLANYMRMIQGNYGSSSTQTTQQSVNPIAGSLGFGSGGGLNVEQLAQYAALAAAIFA
jgi:hypothetical protein